MDNAGALNTPGEPSFYWLPPESRVKLITLLKGFDGLMDDVKNYDYARTSEEISKDAAGE